jgi:hypothetical protein
MHSCTHSHLHVTLHRAIHVPYTLLKQTEVVMEMPQADCARLGEMLYKQLEPALITHLISHRPRRSLVLLPREHRGLQREDVDANITLVNCAFEVWPDRVPSQYDLAASIVLLDCHLSGDLLKVSQVTSDQLPKSVEWAKDYKRVLQHARLLARKTLESGSPAIAHMKRKLSFVSRRETARSPQPQYI